jgi:hypothetical protein
VLGVQDADVAPFNNGAVNPVVATAVKVTLTPPRIGPPFLITGVMAM